MLKFLETLVTFSEVPDEISLCINITNCPCHCPDCHSKHLWTDTGEELTESTLIHLINKNKHISCVCLMGGDADVQSVNNLAKVIKNNNLKSAWYSGQAKIHKDIDINNFDYIKVGPYIKERGPLNNPNTNQVLFNIVDGNLIDITNKFWKND